MSLTDVTVRNAKPKEKAYKLSDGGGLYLNVQPNGGKYWRKKYRYFGKEKTLSIGPYPRVTLSEARIARENAFKLLERGKDPSFEKQEQKRLRAMATNNTFELITRDWWDKKKDGWSHKHAQSVINSLETNIFPHLGKRPVSEITAPQLLEVIRKIEKRGALEISSKVAQRCNAIFRFAIVSGYATYNPAADLREVLKTPERRNHAALKANELPSFLIKLEEYDGQLITKLALKLLLLTFVRSSELRGAFWDEFDFKKAEWRIPADRMKMREEHIVPLSLQSLAILNQLQELNGHRNLVFASSVKPRQSISGNALLYALYRMGYHSQSTVHGFRQTASTILNEHDFSPDAIERQLAHAERNKIRAAYNKAQYLKERQAMMQWWADYLDKLKGQKNV